MNNYPVLHQSMRISPEIAKCDVYTPVDQQLSIVRNKLLIVPGLGSVKTDYRKLAIEAATQGYVVISPDCNNGGGNSALENRRDVVLSLMETLDEPIRLIPHSLGAPVTAMAMEEAKPDNVLSINFMQPAAFTDHGLEDLVGVAQFYLTEFLPRAHRLIPDMMRHNKHHHQRIDLFKRFAETWGLLNLDPDFMINSVIDLHEKEVPMSFLLGPKDKLTPADVIRRAVVPIVGVDRVVDIHPNAGHLAAQTHPRRMARLMIEQFSNSSSENDHELVTAA